IGYNDTLSQACGDASRSGSDWASVPLVPYLRDVARLLHTRQELAIMQSFADVMRKIERRQLARLARSLPGWLTRFGLPGVLATLLTGDFDYASHLATSCYINVSERQVEMAHVSAFRCFEEQIAAECRRRAWPFASVLGPATAPHPSGNREFGLRIVPL